MTNRNRSYRRPIGGMSAAQPLAPDQVERMLHGIPHTDAAQKDRAPKPESPGAGEARALLAAANDAYAKAHPQETQPKGEDETPMNKRQKVFQQMCETAGLKIVDWNPGRDTGRVGGLTEAANGRTQRFTISYGGKDDKRGDLNLQSSMKRFARENIESLTPVGQAMVAAANDSTNPTVKSILKAVGAPAPAPRVHRRVPESERRIDPALTLPKERTFMPSYAKAPVPHFIAPAPVPALAPPPVAAPAPIPAPAPTSIPEKTMTTTTAKPGAQGKLNRQQFYTVTEFLKTIDTKKVASIAALSEMASTALGFKVPSSATKEAVEILGLELLRPVKPLSEAAIVAKALAGLMKALAHPIPEDLAALVAKAGA